MGPTSRLAATAAVLGGALLFAAPASAQENCEYPFDCPTTPPPSAPSNGGGGGGGGGGGSTAAENPSSLPFTGGEITLMALAGTAALGGGIVLVAAGSRRRASD